MWIYNIFLCFALLAETSAETLLAVGVYVKNDTVVIESRLLAPIEGNSELFRFAEKSLIETIVGFDYNGDFNDLLSDEFAFSMIKRDSVYHLMFCFVKSHDVLCGFLEKDKFVINMTYNHCAFLGEGGRVAHLVIGQRTENKQAFFFETVVKEGEPRNIRKCIASVEEVDDATVNPFKGCSYADYDPVDDKAFNCRFEGQEDKIKTPRITTFDGRSWLLNGNGKAFVNKGGKSKDLSDDKKYTYAFALDLDNVKIQTVIPRFFGVKLKDDGCGVEYYQAPSKEVFTSVNFPSPCLPITDNNFYFLRERNMSLNVSDPSSRKVLLSCLHACVFKPEDHSMFCFIVGDEMYKMTYSYLGKCMKNESEDFMEIDGGNVTAVMFSEDRDVFHFQGKYNGFKYNGQVEDCEMIRENDSALISWDKFKNESCNVNLIRKNYNWFSQLYCLNGFSVMRAKNGTSYLKSKDTDLIIADDKADFKTNYDYIFIDDYSGNKVYIPPKPKFFCFRVTFNLLMATLAVDGFLILLFGILFVLEIRGFRKKAYHDIRLELMLQKFTILKAAGRC